jgi:hypothetical protein
MCIALVPSGRSHSSCLGLLDKRTNKPAACTGAFVQPHVFSLLVPAAATFEREHERSTQ